MLQLYKIRFKTAHMTLQDVKDMYDAQPPTDEQLQPLLEAYQTLHDVESAGISFPYLGGRWSIVGWNEQDDDKFRDYIYQLEQDEMFGTYINQRAEFLADWANEEYEPTGSWSFPPELIEKLEPINDLEITKNEVIEGITDVIWAAGHEKDGYYEYVIKRDMTDEQVSKLDELFAADEEHDGISVARDGERIVASVDYKYIPGEDV